MVTNIILRCSYCSKIYKTENGFNRHIENCPERKKVEYLKSIKGQRAIIYFQHWMRKKHNGYNASVESFSASKYFLSFVNFMEFIDRANIPDVEAYIDLMVNLGVYPQNWDNDIAYGKYLEYMTNAHDPLKLVKITINTLYDIADTNNCDITNVFDFININEFITLLSQRNISPWFLLQSEKFADYYMNSANDSEKQVIGKLINPDYWTLKFSGNPEVVKYIREIVVAMEL